MPDQDIISAVYGEKIKLIDTLKYNISDRLIVLNNLNPLENEIIELNSIIEAFAEQNKDNQKYIDDLNFDITNLKISVSSFSESEASIDEIVERVNQDINNSSVSIKNKEKICEELKQENNENNEKIKNLLIEIEKSKQEVSSSLEKIEELKSTRITKNEIMQKLEEEINNNLKLLDDLKDQINKIEIKKSKLEIELEQVVNRMWEEYEITPNTAENYQKPQNVQEVQKKVNELRNQIKALGSINIDSIEEYKQTKERFDFMTEQKTDLEESSNKLKKIIAEII